MKQLISVICLTLSVLGCWMPVSTLTAESVNKDELINTYPNPSPAPVPKMVLQEKQMVCGFWNVRQSANANSASIGIVLSGNTVTLTGREATAIDGGTWVQVEGRDGKGWMNKKGLCGGVK